MSSSRVFLLKILLLAVAVGVAFHICECVGERVNGCVTEWIGESQWKGDSLVSSR